MKSVSGDCVVVDIFSREVNINGQNIFISGGEITFNLKCGVPLDDLIKNTLRHYNKSLTDQIIEKLDLDVTEKGDKKFMVIIK